MPRHLLAACLFYIASLVGMSVIAPLYESGVWRAITPILILSFVATAVLFMLRRQWTWNCMKWMAFFGLVINSAFFPSDEFYGSYTLSAQLLAASEIAACTVILWSLLREPRTKAWFANAGV